MTLNKRLGSALAAVALLATAACGGSDSGSSASGSTCEFGPTDDASWTAQLKEGVSEGKVNWYHVFAPEQGDRVIEAFNKVCPGIKVTATATGKALLPLVESQLASGGDGADVFVWGDEEWFKANEAKMADLNGPFSAAYPEKAYFVPNKVVQAFTLPIGVLAWNTQEFPDGFKDFSELTDPKLKGRIGAREDITTSYIGYLRFLEATNGPEYLTDLAKNDLKFYPSAYVIPNGIASGEIGVAGSSTIAAVTALMDKGAPIDYTIPDKSFVVPSTMGVLADSKRPSAASVLAQFLLSEDGQAALVGKGDGGSQLDVPNALDLSGSELLAASDITDEVRAEWTAKFDDIFR